ncbi:MULTISPECIES: hypothetical protein [Bacillus cereus group]|uniref:hypothetical protein n=1 Tax=Bacillus cereus group TaxID=86661 RepID=UPI000A992B0B|nr:MULTISPECIES: hypothetical protein [Bacillus cereus group]
MKKEGIYIIDAKGESSFFSPPDSGFGEIQIQYCNSIPIMLRETKTLRLAETKKSKATS